MYISNDLLVVHLSVCVCVCVCGCVCVCEHLLKDGNIYFAVKYSCMKIMQV